MTAEADWWKWLMTLSLCSNYSAESLMMTGATHSVMSVHALSARHLLSR